MMVNKQQSTFLINRESKVEVSTVSLKDWWILFSYGVGNFLAIIDVILSWIYSGLYIYMYYILGDLTTLSVENQKSSYHFYLYISIVLISTFLIVINYICHVSLFYSASKNLHNKMTWNLLRAPMQFFDSNSIGSMLTKFTKDIECLGKFVKIKGK